MNYNLNTLHSNSQNSQILEWLQSGKPITALEALLEFGCMRLPSRIHDLKRMGVKITSKTITLDNGKRVSQYSLSQV